MKRRICALFPSLREESRESHTTPSLRGFEKAEAIHFIFFILFFWIASPLLSQGLAMTNHSLDLPLFQSHF
ncbi:hypothetical protein [Helicobacter sp. 23-1045]